MENVIIKVIQSKITDLKYDLGMKSKEIKIQKNKK